MKSLVSLKDFEETFREACERFKEMLRACPHYGFTGLAQIDTFYNGLNDNDQDSLNAAAGGHLLTKTTREALQIIENKSKVRYSRNKPNVSRMNTTYRENATVEESCVTCGGAHAYYNRPNTDSNQPSVCVATGTYNQVASQNCASNYMAPPSFALVQNSQNRFNQHHGQGNNFNRENNYQPFQVSNQGFQNQPFQVPNNQQGFSNEFSSCKKVNDQMMRNMQNQINSLKGEFKNEIQNTLKTQQTVLMEQQNAFQNNLQNMLSGFFQNQSSTSGTLPSNTIPNPKGEMKAITTRSGGNPQYILKDQRIFDSGCSRHMTGNKSFLIDYQEIERGFVAIGGSHKGVVEGEGSGQPSEPQPPSLTTPPEQVLVAVGDEAVYTGEDDRVVRATTTAASLEAKQESEVNTSRSGEDNLEHQDDLMNFIPPTPHDSPLSRGHTPGSDEGKPDINKLMNICNKLSNRVLALEQFKTAQDLVIKRLKKKVTRLEKKQRERTPEMKLFKIGTSKKKTLDKKNVSKQERDESSETKVFGYTTIAKKDFNAVELVFIAGDAVNAASEARPRTTSVVIHDVEEEPRKATPPPTVHSQDKGKYTHNQLKSESFKEIQMLYEREQKWINDFVPMDSEEVNDKTGEDDAEKEELRSCLDIVPVDDIAVRNKEVSVTLKYMMYYQIIRANESSKNYKILIEMRDDFNRQDIRDLYTLVKERYERTSPEGYDLLLWGDLITLFEPSEEDVIWKAQQDYSLISWRLFDSCGVHVLLMDTGIVIHMLVERKYPLIKEMLSRMLNRRLQIDHESEMEFKLIRFIKLQLKE
nr:reverse transcriptase domain-containing protein [Tanacetum cinerariifolium]